MECDNQPTRSGSAPCLTDFQDLPLEQLAHRAADAESLVTAVARRIVPLANQGVPVATFNSAI